jgi:FtsH-binding integral membrane protein
MPAGYANPYAVAAAQPSERAAFIRNAYLHLAGSVLAFTGLVYGLSHASWARVLAAGIAETSWVLVLVSLMAASWIADRWARSGASQGKQYLGLGLFLFVEALLFLPLVLMAELSVPDAVPTAVVLTGFLFAALTVSAVLTGADFSLARTSLAVGGLAALGLVSVGVLFELSPGFWSAGGMLLLATGSILFTTSRMIHDYRPEQHVAAALGLFAGIALLFWHLLRTLMGRG